MRNIIITLLLISIQSICLINFCYAETSHYIPGEVIVSYKSSIYLNSDSQVKNSCCYRQYTDNFLKKNGLTLKDSFDNIALISFDEERNIEEILSLLKSESSVKTAEANYLKDAALNSISTDDFFGNEQRGLSFISRPEAFRQYSTTLRGGASVTVGVIDNGVNYNHVDLQGSRRSPSSCRLNGKSIHCEHGYDFRSNSTSGLPVGDNHGTHLAGIIAATANNSKGMAGVNPYARIASLKVTDDYSSLSSSFDNYAILKAIDFAIENGIKILNASFGSREYSETMRDKIKEFGDYGGVFVTTAMNDGIDIDRTNKIYPCSYDLDNIICVTSINSYGNKSSFGNYGSISVDIAAPGEGILGTINSVTDMYSYYDNFSSCSSWNGGSCGYNEEYQFRRGISSPIYQVGRGANSIVRFDAQCYGGENLRVIIYSNGEYHSAVNLGYVGNNKTEYKVVVPSEISRFSFSIEKEGDTSCSIDNVGVYDVKKFGGESDSYDLWNGTSMATAFVSGLASLIRTINPNLSPVEVKSLILNNGDTQSNLQGITVSGKSINVKKTLDAVPRTTNRDSTSSYSDSTIDEFINDLLKESYGNSYSEPRFTIEESEAFEFASEHGIVSASSIYSADMDGYLTRIGMAKILSQFAINIIGLKPNSTIGPNFYDVSDELDKQYNYGVSLAYQLGIMGVDTHYFRPYDYVTRGEFATAVSRMVYSIDDGGYNGAYYEPHLRKLKDEGILSNATPNRIEKRGLALIILKRIAYKYHFS